MSRPLAGVDGCKGGWIAVRTGPDGLSATVQPTFEALLAMLPADALVAVDMPIGLPEHTLHGGRGPESLVRRMLGPRQSSVFSIPSRAALYAAIEPCPSIEAYHAAHRAAGIVARATSQPPRGVSIQAFGIFPKIRELDGLLRRRPELVVRIFESHPEVAFCRLNGGTPMLLPKKVKGQVNPAGLAERRSLLERHGMQRDFLERPPPAGAAADDLLDAAVMLVTAGRIADGRACPHPDPPARDAYGLPVAIWA